MKLKHIKFVVSLCLMLYLISIVNWDIILELKRHFIFYLMASLLVALLFLWFMVFRWAILIEHFSDIKPKITTLYRYYLIGAFFNIFFPGAIGGDVMRIHYSHQKYHLGIKKATTTVFLERFSGLIGLALIFSFSLFFNETVADQIAIEKAYILLIVPIVLIVTVLFKKISAAKWYSISYKTIGTILVLSILGQFADIFIASILCDYFELSIAVWDLLTIMPLVYIVTVLPISLGGIGVREGAFVGLLSLYGVNASVAVIISFLMYLIRVVIGVAGWAVYINKGGGINDLQQERNGGRRQHQ